MGEFIMIAPAGWVDMQYVNIGMYGNLTGSTIEGYIQSHDFGALETAFRIGGLWPDGMTEIREVKFIDNLYLWAHFA